MLFEVVGLVSLFFDVPSFLESLISGVLEWIEAYVEDKDGIPGSSLCFSSYNKGVETNQQARMLSQSSYSAATGTGKDRLWGTTTKGLIDSRFSERDSSPVTPTWPVTTPRTEVESLLSDYTPTPILRSYQANGWCVWSCSRFFRIFTIFWQRYTPFTPLLTIPLCQIICQP